MSTVRAYQRRGVYVDSQFKMRYTRKYMGGTIKLRGYKTATLLSLVEPPPCEHRTAHTITVWLRDRDFDKLITMLREAKKEWNARHRMTDITVKRQQRRRAR